jgi:hypothetical protein
MTEKSVIKLVTPEILKELFGGKPFLDIVGQVADSTFNTGGEIPFFIAKETFDDRVFYGDVPKSNTGGNSNYATSCRGMAYKCFEEMTFNAGLNPFSNQFFVLVDGHTHQKIHGSYGIFPSWEDFENSYDDRMNWGYGCATNFDSECMKDIRETGGEGVEEILADLEPIDKLPIIAVGELNGGKKRNLTLLLLQDRTPIPNRELLKMRYESVFDHAEEFNNEPVAIRDAFDALPDINAELLHYKRHGKQYRVNTSELKKLARFAFTPKRIKLN